MKKLKIISILSILIFVFTTSFRASLGYSDTQEVRNNGTIFYLTSLNESESFQVNCSSKYNQYYSLFLFNKRPMSNYKYLNGSYSLKLYNLSIEFYEGFNPELVYVANETLIYYIQIILHNESSNLISINSNKDLVRYYLPLIESFSLEIIGITGIFTISIIIVSILKKKKIHI